MKKLLYIIIFLLCLSGWAFGANPYWTSPTGAASWANCQSATQLSGTAACSLATVNTNASAGSLIVFNDGDYSTTLNPTNSGTSGNEITFQSLYEWSNGASGTQYGAKLEGTYGINLINGQDWLIFDGFGRDNYHTANGVIAYDADDIVFKNAHFSANNDGSSNLFWIVGATDSGTNCNRWEIANCIIDRIYGEYTEHGGELLQFGNYEGVATKLYMHDNIIVDAAGHGTLIFTMAEDIVVYNNTFYSTGNDDLATGYGYFICAVAGCKRVIIEDNLFYEGTVDRYDKTRHIFHNHETQYSIFRGNKSGWIDGRSADYYTSTYWSSSQTCSYNMLYHNTYYRTLMDSWLSAGTSHGVVTFDASTSEYTRRNRFANNIIHTVGYTNPSLDAVIGQTTYNSSSAYLTENVFYGNMFYNYSGPFLRKYLDGVNSTYTFSQAESTFPSEFWNNINATDPKLTDPTNYNFILQSDSPCIDAAQPLTYTNGSGSGTSMDVDDYTAYMFQALSITGWAKDTIYVDNPSSADFFVQLSAIVDYNTLTLSESKTWDDNAKIYWCPQGSCFSGSAPDIGAEEYELQAYDVSPADGETGVSVTKVATWNYVSSVDGVYRWLTKDTCANVAISPGACNGTGTQDLDNSYDMSTLDSSSNYCLELKAYDGSDYGNCQQFDFTTTGGPPPVSTSFGGIKHSIYGGNILSK